MRSLTILEEAVSRLQLISSPRRIVELGAGDGSLMLRFARAHCHEWTDVHLTLLDRQDLVSASTRNEFGRLGWHLKVVCADALEWARQTAAERFHLCLTTLFLHHLDDGHLGVLLKAMASRTEALIACEPRRNFTSRVGSRLIGLLGANEVTREDAVKSVAAGFTADELSRVWAQAGGQWRTQEYSAMPFTHCFLALRVESQNCGASDRGH